MSKLLNDAQFLIDNANVRLDAEVEDPNEVVDIIIGAVESSATAKAIVGRMKADGAITKGALAQLELLDGRIRSALRRAIAGEPS